jgi:plastocyanin
MPSPRRRTLLGLLTIVLLVAVGCGSSKKSTAASGSGRSVTIKNFAFSPANVDAKVGDTITVTNDDGAAHTLTAVDMSFDTGAFSTGSKTITVAKPGRFEFQCNVHPFMSHGFIQVSG